MATKKNPADLTGRNLRAAKAREARFERRLEAFDRRSLHLADNKWCLALEVRMATLEKRLAHVIGELSRVARAKR